MILLRYEAPTDPPTQLMPKVADYSRPALVRGAEPSAPSNPHSSRNRIAHSHVVEEVIILSDGDDAGSSSNDDEVEGEGDIKSTPDVPPSNPIAGSAPLPDFNEEALREPSEPSTYVPTLTAFAPSLLDRVA